jgi:hypothetical protein
MTTLLNDLLILDGTYGLATTRLAGGMAQAMIVEQLA